MAVVQGLTEFLPISSSGHLVIFQKFFGFDQPPVSFDILLHLGSLLAIFLFLKDQIFRLILNFKNEWRLILAIVIGTFPAALLGVGFKKEIEATFDSLALVAVFYLVTAALLFSTRLIRNKKQKKLSQISPLEALLLGIFQAIAVFPGISRSGSTIVGGLWQNFSPEAAFQFSFLLAIPAILGATVIEAREMTNQINFFYGGLAMIISVATSLLSLKFLSKMLKSEKLYLFSGYCFLTSLVLLVYLHF